MERNPRPLSEPQPGVLDYASPLVVEPITLSRPPFVIAAGALMYLAAAPIAALVVGAILRGLLYGLLTSMGVKPDLASSLVFPVFLLCAAGVVVYCVRDYLGRAHFRLRIFPDRMEGGRPLARWACSFDEIRTVLLVRRRGRTACVIELHSGRTRLLPPDVAGIRAVEATLNAWLMPTLAAKLWQRLLAGEVLKMKGRRWFGVWRGAGFGVSQHGVIPRGGCDLVAWTEITAVKLSEAGLLVVSKRGRLFASFDSRDVWPASFLIENRVRELCRSE